MPTRPSSCDSLSVEWSKIGFLVAAGLALIHFVSLWGVGLVDDDYIVWQYARTWVEGGGYAFFPGAEPSDGVTSPLWFLVCAMFVKLGVAPEVATPLVGGVCFVLAAGCVGASSARLVGGQLRWVPGLLVALSPAAAWHAHAGLGTLPAALAVALVVIWLQRPTGSASWRVGIALAVGVGMRPELLVLVPIAACFGGDLSGTPGCVPAGWTNHLKRALPVVSPTVCLVALVTVWRWQLFGTILPATAVLKSLPLQEELGYGSRYALRSVHEGGLSALLLIGASSLVVAGASRAQRFLGAACITGLVAVVAVGGDWMIYSRLFVPLIALAELGATASVARVPSAGLRTALGVVLVAFVVAGFKHRAPAKFDAAYHEAWWLEVGDVFAARTGPDSTIATSPIGAIAWRSRRRVIDILGLTHGEFLELEPRLGLSKVKGHHRFDGAWVLDQQPDYLLLGNVVVQPDTRRLEVNPWEGDIVQDPRFERDYLRESTLVEGKYREPKPLLYARRRSARKL